MSNKLKLFYTTSKERFEPIIDKLDIAILILYGLFVFEAFLRSTTFEINWHPYYHMSLKAILILLVFGKSLLKFMDNIPLYMLLGFCSVGFLLAYLQGNHGILLELILFTIAFVDIDFDKVITVFTITIGISLFIVILGSQTNILNNLIYTSEQRSTRISFGIHYPTNFASYVFYLCSSWLFIRKMNISYTEITTMYVLSYIILRFCDAQTSTICLILLLSFTLVFKILTNFNKEKKDSYKAISFLLMSIFPFSSIFSILFTNIFSYDLKWIVNLDNFLSNRFSIGKITINNFDVKLWGQHIEMEGNGGYSLPWYNYNTINKSGYNFIDSSYLSILFRYGLFVFICVMVLFTLTSFVARKHNDYITLIIIAIIAIHSIMEHHLLDFNYNPFMFLLVSSYYVKHINKHKIKKSSIKESEKALLKEGQT
ncbi:MAG: hypothetical protein J6A25_10460 [Lachnospiraceae bacterium]|nr:hypothetical protein [Lachnospiraceae bacterium]